MFQLNGHEGVNYILLGKPKIYHVVGESCSPCISFQDISIWLEETLRGMIQHEASLSAFRTSIKCLAQQMHQPPS